MQKFAIITGGGSGIGQAVAHNLSDHGLDVLIVGRRTKALEETKAHQPKRIQILQADVSSSSGREKLLAHVEKRKQIDFLIHNAGIVEPITPISDIKVSDWRKTQATNVEAPLFLTQGLLPKLKGGRVLHISSGLAHLPMSSWCSYCTSKAGLFMIYQCLKEEFGESVSFGSVMPGIVDTEMQAVIRHTDDTVASNIEFFRQLKDENKLLTSQTVANFLAWLLLSISAKRYAEQEWDIYDGAHHREWLPKGQSVPNPFG
jgi:benzil reductase ((S)-benzoin forming)